jgi:DNA-binding response OmpR family regulator
VRVLVVEDEERLAAGLSSGLVAEGFAVDVALTGVDGLWLARENSYDAIVLDIMLPGVDGREICRTLRGESDWTPILILTAKDAEHDEIAALDGGADDYLTKPFSHAVLVARLRSLFRRGGTERPAVLVAGDLEVDPATRAVARAGRRIRLSAREFAVLEFLARRAGQVVSRTELLEHVWDRNYEGSTNIVDVYVGYLRRKLENPFGRPLIQTVRGAGYLIEP